METRVFQEWHLESIWECSFRPKFPLPVLTILLRKRYPSIYRVLPSSPYTVLDARPTVANETDGTLAFMGFTVQKLSCVHNEVLSVLKDKAVWEYKNWLIPISSRWREHQEKLCEKCSIGSGFGNAGRIWAGKGERRKDIIGRKHDISKGPRNGKHWSVGGEE